MLEKLNPEDKLTAPQVAKLCGVAIQTVEEWIKTAGLKAEQSPVTKHYQVLCKELLEFLTKNKKTIPAEFSGMTKKRILIVDDEQNMISAIRRILLDGENYIFETANDGFEAGQKIEKFKPHLVILDIWMPKMDGFKLCSSIKNNTSTRQIKVLAISGLVKKEDQRIGRDFGADAFLEKPFSNEEFEKTVKQLLT